MKTAIYGLAGSAALLGEQPASASEAYVVPDAATLWVFQGTIDVYKGITLTCSATIDPIAAGNISYSNGAFTFHDVFVRTYPQGDCQGGLHFVWDENAAPQSLDIQQQLPPVAGAPCAFSGWVDLASPRAGDVRAPGDPDHDPHADI